MRQGELFNLRWDDVDLDAGVLRVRGTKNARSRRTVALSETASEAISRARWRKSTGRGVPVAGERPRVRHGDRHPPQPPQCHPALVQALIGAR
jgi:integrase